VPARWDFLVGFDETPKGRESRKPTVRFRVIKEKPEQKKKKRDPLAKRVTESRSLRLGRAERKKKTYWSLLKREKRERASAVGK